MTTDAIPYQAPMTVSYQRSVKHIAIALGAFLLLAWTVFPFVWILLTSLKNPGDIISVPPKFVFAPTFDNYAALVMGEQRGQYSSTRPDFPLFFLNSMIISLGAVALSVVAGIPAAYALARFDFPMKDGLDVLRVDEQMLDKVYHWLRKNSKAIIHSNFKYCTYGLIE